MNASLLPLLLTLVGRAAQQGTLIEIVETIAKLARLVEPLIPKPDGASGH